jgi:hypothetical protein
MADRPLKKQARKLTPEVVLIYVLAGIIISILSLGGAFLLYYGYKFGSHPARLSEIFAHHNDDSINALGLPEHDNDQQVLSARIPANAAIDIQNPRGDISITASDASAIEVQAHEVAYASSDKEAKKTFDAEAPHLTVSGSAVLVKSDGSNRGRLDLTITIPRGASVTVDAGKGDVTAAGLGAGIKVTARGDVHLSAITGPAEVHFAGGKHDLAAHDLRGDMTIDGDLNDLTLSEIKGKVTQSGEVLGDMHLEGITGPLHLHTSVTDLQLAELPGDLALSSDDLRINEARGPVRVVTHSKDVDLNQIYGDSYVEDRDGSISVEPAGAYSVEAENSKGDVEVTLPPNASATVNARTHNGDIVSDFASPSAQGENKLASFQIGSGGAKITLSTDNGDVRIKKGSALPRPANTPQATAAPSAPHLKRPKAPPALQ